MGRSDVSASRVPPNNTAAEESLLGAMLLSKEAIKTASEIVVPGDFYKPAHAMIFVAVMELWNEGRPADLVTVAEQLKRNNDLDIVGGPSALLSLQTRVPATSNAKRYAKIVMELAIFRRIIGLAGAMADAAYEQPDDPNEVIELFTSELSAMGISVDDAPPDLWQLDAYLDQPEHDRAPWCIPGLIRVGWRIMVVAAEGVGKTVLFRQIAICAAQGIHPLNFGPITPCRSLIVDLENPQDSVIDVCNPIRDKALAAATTDYDPDRAWLWWRPGGIDLRRRADRIAFEGVLAQVRPDLVCMGPLYKAYEVSARESDEIAAREVMAILDDLRTRYKFGLLLEHHAPKESGGNKRKMMPYGSSFWLRWPEIGIGFYPEGEGLQTLLVDRWRGDRLENQWPIKINRSERWPWAGEWADGAGASWAKRAGGNPAPTPVELGYEDPEDEEGGWIEPDEPF